MLLVNMMVVEERNAVMSPPVVRDCGHFDIYLFILLRRVVAHVTGIYQTLRDAVVIYSFSFIVMKLVEVGAVFTHTGNL